MTAIIRLVSLSNLSRLSLGVTALGDSEQGKV